MLRKLRLGRKKMVFLYKKTCRTINNEIIGFTNKDQSIRYYLQNYGNIDFLIFF